MIVSTTSKYIADDGKQFDTAEDCQKWESCKRVYILEETYHGRHTQSYIIGVYNSKHLAELEKEKKQDHSSGYSLYIKSFELKGANNG